MYLTFNYINDMIIYMSIFLPVIVIWRIIIIKHMKNNNIKTTKFHEIGIIIFALFLIGLASQTINIDANISTTNSDINLKPFLVFKQTYHTVFVDKYLDYFIINFLGNIVIFMPIGFFIPTLWNKKHPLVKSVLTGFLISLFIELAQLFLPRRTDIDDLILNTFGSFLGYNVFYIINKMFPKFISKFKTSNI